MKVIRLTDEQYDILLDDLNEISGFRWNSDHYHANDCFSEGKMFVENNTEEDNSFKGFESKESYARFNFLVDKLKGCAEKVKWEDLSDDVKQMYFDEAESADYMIEDSVIDLFEIILHLSYLNMLTHDDINIKRFI